MKKMSKAEWQAFLAGPVRTGKLATVKKNGAPHVAPIWFVLDGDDVIFNTGRDSVKGRNLRLHAHAALCVDDEKAPYAFVTIEGPVTLSEDPHDLVRWATVIGGRYMGADQAQALGQRNGAPGSYVVRLRAEKVVAVYGVAD
jgi:hypothetical protein